MIPRKTQDNRVSFAINLEDYPLLNRGEIDELRESFKRKDKEGTGVVYRFDAIDILRDVDQYINEAVKKKLFHELDNRGIKQIDFPTICFIANFVKKLEEEEGEEDINDEYINAFVAMGGNPDKSGYVNKEKIVDIIKNEFGLSIEEFLDDLHDTEVDFSAFCRLFEAIDESRTLSRASGLASVLTERFANRPDSSFVVRYKDFERFLEKDPKLLKF